MIAKENISPILPPPNCKQGYRVRNVYEWQTVSSLLKVQMWARVGPQLDVDSQRANPTCPAPVYSFGLSEIRLLSIWRPSGVTDFAFI